MQASIPSIRGRLDRFGMVLSGLCAIHCLLGLIVVTALGLGAGVLLHPAVHKVGLALAVVVGIVTIGLGALRHGKPGPLVAGVLGLCLMTAGVAVGHGWREAALTIAGVALVALAHIRNLRHAA